MVRLADETDFGEPVDMGHGREERRQSCLFVINSLGIGGAERVLLETVRALSATMDITVVVLGSDPDENSFAGQMADYAQMRTCLVCGERDPWPKRLVRSFWMRLSHRLWNLMSPRLLYRMTVGSAKRYDMEIAFLEGWPTRAVYGSTNPASRKYAWVHTDMTSDHCAHDFKNDEEERAAYASFDRVFAVSSDVARSLETRFGVQATYLQNIVDDAAVKVLATESSDIAPMRRPCLMAVGRLVEVKGYGRLVEAAAELLGDGYDFELHIVGDGPEADALRAAIDRRGIGERVHLDGFRENPYPCIAAADLLVCSSYSEGFSGTVTEALLLGTPVLTTNCSGMRDLLGDSEYGLIVDNEDRALLDGMRKLLDDPTLLEKYAAKAHERGRMFSASKLTANVIAALSADPREG